MRTKVIAIERAWWHFSKYSGYGQFLKYLPADMDVELIRVDEGMDQIGLRWLDRSVCRLLSNWRLSRASTPNDIAAEIGVAKRLRRSLDGYDRVIVHFLYGEQGYNWYSWLARVFRNDCNRVKTVVTYHQPDRIMYETLAYPGRVSMPDMLVLMGGNQIQYFRAHGGKTVRVIHHGVDTVYFRPPAGRPIGENIHCLTLGHWLRDFKVLSKVVEKAPKGVRFRVVAYPEEIEPFGFKRSPRIDLRTGISDEELRELYWDTTIGIMPLEDGTANNSLLEMMATGLPIVATDVGAVREYVPDGAALFCAKGDADAMLRSIMHLAGDAARRAVMGGKGRERAVELDWRRVAERTAGAYVELFE